MATLADIRAVVNVLVRRTDGTAHPWNNAELDEYAEQAVEELWPDVGNPTSGTVATDHVDQIYVLPSSIQLPQRFILEQSTGGITHQVDRVVDWRWHAPGQVILSPVLPTSQGLAIRVYGWVPFVVADLPATMERLVAMKAAGLAFGQLASSLQDQRHEVAMEPGARIGYGDAVGLSAYWERRYEERLLRVTSVYRPRTDPHAA